MTPPTRILLSKFREVAICTTDKHSKAGVILSLCVALWRCLTPASEQVYLILFGTGVRGRDTSLIAPGLLAIEGAVDYAGSVRGLAGLDQVNVRLLRRLAGQGESELHLRIENYLSNKVLLSFK